MPKIHLSSRLRALIAQDVVLFLSAFVATGVLGSDHLTVDALVAAVVTAAKVVVRHLVPAPAAK